MLNPGLRRSTVDPFIPTVVRILDETMGSRASGTWEALTLFEQVTSRAIAEYYFGDDVHGVPEAAGQLLDALSRIIGNPFALPASFNSPARRRVNHRLRELRRILDPLITARVSSPDTFSDFATTVLQARHEDRGQTVDRIVTMLIGTMLAAHRVPAAAASWMFMLALEDGDDADLWSRLGDEGSRFRDELSTGVHRLEQFPWAMATVLESLRLFPPTWLLSRDVYRSTALGRFDFERGDNFLISPYVIHRDAALFPQPESFRPSRWIPGEQQPTVGRAHYLPFGAGLRACPGNHLATATLTAIVLAVASRWDLRRAPGVVTPNPRTTLIPDGLRLTLGGERAQPGPAVGAAGT